LRHLIYFFNQLVHKSSCHLNEGQRGTLYHSLCFHYLQDGPYMLITQCLYRPYMLITQCLSLYIYVLEISCTSIIKKSNLLCHATLKYLPWRNFVANGQACIQLHFTSFVFCYIQCLCSNNITAKLKLAKLNVLMLLH
jgi:hypothetical protein